ncbi:Putative peroxiredoxin/MT2597 [Devosia equisanguinis]|uniref:thioredoxin-dependent peroxiredoxin n=1 Tax=Devosia equisanguinis TaxID=2490941 RepID=A0A3S4CE13_9HYPH|nr:peroxiredoxin [Devosia equisanguinis]VDS05978.1 Putative peroxiredoxin/MT2597 [Devosia equisanguinis]
MTQLKIGDIAPDFTLPRDDGSTVTLSALRGQPVVIFFYPEDDSGGCTDENREFSELAADFANRDAALIGISPDDLDKHRKFRAKYGLTVPLVADPEHKAIAGFGLWQLKKLYGREFMGLVRTSFIIGADGRVAAIVRATRIKGHAAKMLEALDGVLSGGAGKARKGGSR